MAVFGKRFKGAFLGAKFPEWGVEEDGLVVGGKKYPYENLTSKPKLQNVPASALTNGTIAMQLPESSKVTALTYKYNQKSDALEAVDYICERIEAANGEDENRRYYFRDKTGSTLAVYDDYVIISLQRTSLLGVGEILRGGSSGGKRINMADITAITFREPAGITVGVIQFAYPGSIEKGGGTITDAVNDENSVLVDVKDVPVAREIVAFIEERRAAINAGYAKPIEQVSQADELRKFKELLDEGIITQEEFDAKKKQLLGL